MTPRLLSARPSVTRTSRHDPRGAALESVAAEFALLAQRRARTARQIDLLERQLTAAQTTLDSVQNRMTLLAQRMHGIDPSLRNAAPPPVPCQPPPFYAPPTMQFQPPPTYAPPRPDAPTQTKPRILHVPRMKRQPPRRRPFSPE